jgi:hypothetical protein
MFAIVRSFKFFVTNNSFNFLTCCTIAFNYYPLLKLVEQLPF